MKILLLQFLDYNNFTTVLLSNTVFFVDIYIIIYTINYKIQYKLYVHELYLTML